MHSHLLSFSLLSLATTLQARITEVHAFQAFVLDAGANGLGLTTTNAGSGSIQ